MLLRARLSWAEIRVHSITHWAKPVVRKQEVQTQTHRHREGDTQREGQVNQRGKQSESMEQYLVRLTAGGLGSKAVQWPVGAVLQAGKRFWEKETSKYRNTQRLKEISPAPSTGLRYSNICSSNTSVNGD